MGFNIKQERVGCVFFFYMRLVWKPKGVFFSCFCLFFSFFVFFCVVSKAQSAKKRAEIFGAWGGFDKMEYGVGVCGQTDDLIR